MAGKSDEGATANGAGAAGFARVSAALALATRPIRAIFARGANSGETLEGNSQRDLPTGLCNRVGLAQAIAQRAEAGRRMALLYLDLDGAVDEGRIKDFAGRLRTLCRASDLVARIGVDEFAVLSTLGDPFAIQTVGDTLIAALGEDNLRIGIAISPDHGKDLGNLLGEADTAVHYARYGSGGRCVVAKTDYPPAPAPRLQPLRPAAPVRRLHRDAA
jgi:GGDEF domain-containing protein